jgi:hypothetical protein
MLLAAACAGIVLRIWVVLSSLGDLDGDEAIVGLMARHISHGDIPVFYWGQQYGGSLEAILAAPGIRLFGASVTALRFVPLALFAVAVVLCWHIARRVYSEKTAWFAAALFCIWPGYFIFWSLKERGFYGVALVATLAVLFFVFRVDAGWAKRDLFLLGLSIGVGWWTTPQVMVAALPGLSWLGTQWSGPLRRAGWIVGGAALGALPWLIENMGSGMASVKPPDVSGDATFYERLGTLITKALPSAIGLRLEGDRPWLLGRLGEVAFIAFLVLLVYILVRKSNGLIAISIALFPIIYALSPFSQGEPRYLYVLSPLLVLAVAGAVRGRRTQIAVMAVALVTAVSLIGRMDDAHHSPAFGRDAPVPEDLPQSASALKDLDIDTLFADYWVAYPVSFWTEEEVIGTPYRGSVRNAEWDALARADDTPAFLAANNSDDVLLLRSGLDGLDVTYDETTIGSFTLFTVEGRVAPESIPGIQ